MKLTSFITELKDSFEHENPEIQKKVEIIKDQLKKMGFKQEPYPHTYKFKDSTEELMAQFTNGIVEFVFYIDHDKDEDHYKLIINGEIIEKYSVTSKPIALISYSVKQLSEREIIDKLEEFVKIFPKLENFVDWAFDVTAQFANIKFKDITSIFTGSSQTTMDFIEGIGAIGGEYSFTSTKGEGVVYQ